MSGGSLGSRASHGSSLSPPRSTIPRRPSTKMLVLSSKDRERILPVLWWYLVRRKVAMVIMAALALLVLIWGTVTVSKEDIADRISWITNGTGSGPPPFFPITPPSPHTPPPCQPRDSFSLLHHPCHSFKLPPSPPSNGRRIGPRPCPVCYVSPEQASVSMPCTPSESPVLRELTYVVDENPIKTEPHAGSDFAGYPSLNQRTDSFDIRESMTVHCGFVRGSKPGQQTGFDIDEADLVELEQPHEVIVASAIFGNYDIIQQPENISEAARKNVPFYMFIDEETEAFLKNTSVLDSSMRVGFWRIIVVRNIPYTDARCNGKIPKLLLHRILPNVRYSIWIDGKLQLVVDPYQVLERFLWREKANFAISRHYKRFDLFEEAEANKAAGKYDNASIDYQIEFYKKEGLTPYTEAKLPITSDVPEGCVIIREHVPITNLFTCLWFNEVDRFTARDQLSFSSVRDKMMEKVNWTVNMFLDCERRNFVIQRYHKDLLDRMPPPAVQLPRPLRRDTSSSSAVRKNPSAVRNTGKNPSKRGRDRRSGSRQHRKAAIGNRSKQVASKAMMMQQY